MSMTEELIPQTEIPAVYIVPARNIADLEERIEKLNRRAAKLGCEPIVLNKTFDHLAYEAMQPDANGHEPRRVWISEHNWDANQASMLPATKTGRVMEFFAITVEGQSPSLNGWHFIATLEPIQMDEGGQTNLIQTVPGKTCPTEYRNLIGRCDHCGADRKRKQTFVLLHDDGTYKCVGRQCIKDFLGFHADPGALAGQAEWLGNVGSALEAATEWESDDFDFGGGSRGEQAWSLDNFLAWTSGMIDAYGWLGRGKAYEKDLPMSLTTASKVVFVLSRPHPMEGAATKREREEMRAKANPTDAHKAKAEAAIEWARNVPEAELNGNDYLANLNTIARAGYVTMKFDGVAASLMVAYDRAMEIETKRKAPRPPSKHVGVIGKRQEMTVKCLKVYSNETDWGITGIHKLVDLEGNDLVWFASESSEWLKEGHTYRVKATPKKHDDYQGRPQTVVNRLTVLLGIVEGQEKGSAA